MRCWAWSVVFSPTDIGGGGRSRICSASGSAARRRKSRKRADQFIADATEIAEGDLVVHQDHGIGRYAGLDHPYQVNGARA